MPHLPDDTDDPSFENLIRYIQDSRGFDFRGYKRSSLRRRIAASHGAGATPKASPPINALLEAASARIRRVAEHHPDQGDVILSRPRCLGRAEAGRCCRSSLAPRTRPRGRSASGASAARPDEEPYSLAMLFCRAALGAAEFAQAGEDLCDRSRRGGAQSPRAMPHTCRATSKTCPEELLPQVLRSHRPAPRGQPRPAQVRDLRPPQHRAMTRRSRGSTCWSCRNLLIYLSTEAQNLVLPRLHYALVEDGILFLGKAETQLARSKLFQPTRHQAPAVPARRRRIGVHMPGGGIMPRGERRDVTVPQPDRTAATRSSKIRVPRISRSMPMAS